METEGGKGLNMIESNNQLESSLRDLSKDELIGRIDNLEKNIKIQESFLVNIAHDLKNPINIILSILQYMKYVDNAENGEVKRLEYRGLIRRNSLKMMKLIDNLIDATKLEGNYYGLNKSMVDIISLVEGTVLSINKYAEQKNIELIFDTNMEECIVFVDPEAIDRIVVNLLSNAIKFSPNNGQIMINIFINKTDINISVKDEGPGIDKKDQKAIFSRFKQSSQKKNSEKVGSGIGLDLVSCLTKLHGGKISLKTKLNEGSNFIVSLPKVQEEVSTETSPNNSINSNDKVQRLEIEFSDIYF